MFRIFRAGKSYVMVEHENFIRINLISKKFFNGFNYIRSMNFANSFPDKIKQAIFFASKEFGSCIYFQRNLWFYIVEEDEKIDEKSFEYFKNLKKCIELNHLNHVVLDMVDVRFLMRYSKFDSDITDIIKNSFDDLDLAFYLLD